MGNRAETIAARLSVIAPKIPSQVRLIAVTKTFPADVVRAAYESGIRDFGENKLQEAIAKQSKLSDLTDVTWHFIGQLQSNKTRKVLNHFDWIHSIGSLKLAQRIDRQAGDMGKRPKCCLQVKLRPDANKAGFDVPDLKVALPELDALAHLEICGLMVIPPYGLSSDENRSIFEQGAALATEIRQGGWETVQMNELSMGMSRDFEQAIASGSTMVRIGSSLFGYR